MELQEYSLDAIEQGISNQNKKILFHNKSINQKVRSFFFFFQTNCLMFSEVADKFSFQEVNAIMQ